jgi:hypothetical protein
MLSSGDLQRCSQENEDPNQTNNKSTLAESTTAPNTPRATRSSSNPTTSPQASQKATLRSFTKRHLSETSHTEVSKKQINIYLFIFV